MVCACFEGLTRSLCPPVVPDALCQVGSLYKNPNVDSGKLRRLILDGRLAPVFQGTEDASMVHDQHHEQYLAVVAKLLKKKKQDASKLQELLAEYEPCPICFLHYPVLNTARCCAQRVCTECYLQVQCGRGSGVPACPFCKVPGFSAKFMGLKTLDLREAEKAEEQKVIEARIREREEEIRRDQEREEQRAQQQRAATSPTTAQHISLPPIATAPQTAASPSHRRDRVPLGRGATPRSQAESPAHQGSLSSAAVSASSSPRVVPLSQVNARTLALAQQHMEEERVAARQAVSGQQPRVATTASGSVAPPSTARRSVGQASGGSPGAGVTGAYRLADFIPNTYADVAVDLDAINDFMLEQAMYESLAAQSAASPAAPTSQPAASSSPAALSSRSARPGRPPPSALPPPPVGFPAASTSRPPLSPSGQALPSPSARGHPGLPGSTAAASSAHHARSGGLSQTASAASGTGGTQLRSTGSSSQGTPRPPVRARSPLSTVSAASLSEEEQLALAIELSLAAAAAGSPQTASTAPGVSAADALPAHGGDTPATTAAGHSLQSNSEELHSAASSAGEGAGGLVTSVGDRPGATDPLGGYPVTEDSELVSYRAAPAGPEQAGAVLPAPSVAPATESQAAGHPHPPQAIQQPSATAEPDSPAAAQQQSPPGPVCEDVQLSQNQHEPGVVAGSVHDLLCKELSTDGAGAVPKVSEAGTSASLTDALLPAAQGHSGAQPLPQSAQAAVRGDDLLIKAGLVGEGMHSTTDAVLLAPGLPPAMSQSGYPLPTVASQRGWFRSALSQQGAGSRSGSAAGCASGQDITQQWDAVNPVYDLSVQSSANHSAWSETLEPQSQTQPVAGAAVQLPAAGSQPSRLGAGNEDQPQHAARPGDSPCAHGCSSISLPPPMSATSFPALPRFQRQPVQEPVEPMATSVQQLAEAVAASQPAVYHVGMLLVQPDPACPQQPTAPQAAAANTAAAASTASAQAVQATVAMRTAPVVEAFVTDLSGPSQRHTTQHAAAGAAPPYVPGATQPGVPVLLVQNPDGTVCSAATAAGLDPAAQAVQSAATAPRPMAAYEQRLLRADLARLASQQRAVDSATYYDVDLPGEAALGDLPYADYDVGLDAGPAVAAVDSYQAWALEADGTVVQSIAARDAQLRAAYQR